MDPVTKIQVATLCLGFLNLIALAITAGAAIYYAYQAKAQVEKTKEIVLLGERDFEPNVLAEIHSPETIIETGTKKEKIPIAALCLPDSIGIPIKYTNLSRGISEFTMVVCPWIENAEGETTPLYPGVKQGLYNGTTRHIMREHETRETNFTIDFKLTGINKEILAALGNPSSLAKKISELFSRYGWIFHIQIFIDYLNERTRIAPRYYDHYRSAPWTRIEINHIVGFWIFEGRSETPYFTP